MEVLKQIQPDIMLALGAVCGILALLVSMTNTMSKRRRLALMILELASMFLMMSDRLAYLYRGDTTSLGWWMVRISNFLVFLLTLVVIFSFNLYLIDLYTHEGGLDPAPRRLKLAHILSLIGMAMVGLSQFTGFYYTFDEMNRYQRAPGFIVCYLIPLTILILQVSVILQHREGLSRSIRISLKLFSLMCITASVLQVFFYGVSLNNMTIASMAVLLYILALNDMSSEVKHAREREIQYYKEEKEKEHALFEQTAQALASAIDAKDTYTHGHSARVAMYSTQIAREAGMSDEDCEKIYFAALLHDVGKIGIPDAIINKNGRLTDEEFAQIKLHPVYGNQILSSIYQLPYLSIGAHYHHERYDGRGYPEGLKGEDIPEIARMIAVADSYDAMTSKRSYRDTIPQQKVREELVKGMGSQFDPKYAKIMLHMLDLDIEYGMREHKEENDDTFITRIKCNQIYYNCSLGIHVTDKKVLIRLYCRSDEGFSESESLPTLLLFDSLDGRVHVDEDRRKELLYLEYARLRFDGKSTCEGARKLETHFRPLKQQPKKNQNVHFSLYSIEAVRVKDHMLVTITDDRRTVEFIVALPDSVRFSYISLTGEHCMISNIHIDREDDPVPEDTIPRIAEEISYIKGCPEGIVPNVQITGWCAASTEGIPLIGNMKLTFHSRSLPTARLVWHCPYVSLFTSKDGQVKGEGYREFLLLRLDGENWDSDEHATNDIRINHTHQFPGWNTWKEENKKGIDWEVLIRRDGNQVEMVTETLGISILNKTTIRDEVEDLYIALTGDQCTLTDVHAVPE